jgi:copper chaperone CopZ
MSERVVADDVPGLTCGHCVAAAREGLAALPGVQH